MIMYPDSKGLEIIRRAYMNMPVDLRRYPTKDVIMSVPFYLLQMTFGKREFDFDNPTKLFDYNVIPCYENKIIFFHICYPVYKYDYMKFEFEFDSMFETSKENGITGVTITLI